MKKIVSKFLQEYLHLPVQGITVTKLHGDASYRTYFRAELKDGRSFIIIKLPEGMQSASEEITNLQEKPADLPFLEIARYLKSRGLPVPEVFHVEKETGILLLEDLGDETLERRLQRSSPEERDRWYRKAIDLLVQFQTKTGTGGGCIAHRRSFDETLLNWEFEHFLEYGVEARLKIKIPAGDRNEIRQEMHQISAGLVNCPQLLVHRDYQSRNLMIRGNELTILDFQDALIGPLTYDLAALLRDSYVRLPPETVEGLTSHYLKVREEKTGERIDPTFFRRIFDWTTVQRKLKDAGRFVYIEQVKKNPAFLKFIPTSLAYAREALERQPELQKLFELLKNYVPEFN